MSCKTPLRHLTAALFLITLVCLTAVPAAAQPRRAPAPGALVETDTGLLARAWLWLRQVWAPTGGLEQGSMKASGSAPITPDQIGGSGVGMNRGGTYDPNGSQ